MANPPEIQLDPVKYLNNLPQFSGNQNDLLTFTKLIDRIYPILATYDALSQLLFSDIIKSRITGRAKEILEINSQAQSWNEIKETLNNNFGERKSCEELFDDLRAVTFITNTVDFYNDIKYRLRRLNNKSLLILGEGEASNQVAINNQRSALNIFKSKIPEPMKTVLACRNPQSLESAMNILYENGYDRIGRDARTHFERPKISKGYQKYPNNSQPHFSRQENHNERPRNNRQQNRNYFYKRNAHNQQNEHQTFQQDQRWNNQNQQQHREVEPMEINAAQNFRPVAYTGNYHI